jgi:hypothetical protein
MGQTRGWLATAFKSSLASRISSGAENPGRGATPGSPSAVAGRVRSVLLRIRSIVQRRCPAGVGARRGRGSGRASEPRQLRDARRCASTPSTFAMCSWTCSVATPSRWSRFQWGVRYASCLVKTGVPRCSSAAGRRTVGPLATRSGRLRPGVEHLRAHTKVPGLRLRLVPSKRREDDHRSEKWAVRNDRATLRATTS